MKNEENQKNTGAFSMGHRAYNMTRVFLKLECTQKEKEREQKKKN